MASLQELESGLVKADAAGNADDARAFANEIRRMRAEAPDAASESRDADGGLVLSMSHEDDSAEPKQRGMAESVGRQVGLTARGIVSGVTAIPGMLADVPVRLLNAAGAGLPLPSEAQQRLMTNIGLPEPENGTERVAQGVVGALSGTGGTMKLGQALEATAAPIAAGVGKLLSGSPIVQSVGAASGAAAGGIVQEQGGGMGAQITASLLGGVGPGALAYGARAAPRGLLRGGEAGRQNMLANIAMFDDAGAVPTIGQASQNRLSQALESTLSRTPGGAGVMNKRAVAQTGDIGRTVDGIVDRLSPGTGPVEAGESVTRGLEGFKAGVKTLQSRLYDQLDEFLPADTPIAVSRSKDALAALNSDIEGAPALSAMFKNSRIQGIERALASDLRTESAPYGHRLPGQASRPDPTLPYESIKKLRTLVGKEIDNANFTSDVPRDKWRALYAALSDDLGDAATKAGPEATDAWQWANHFTKSQTGRLDELNGIMGKDSPEKVFNAALLGTKDGDTIVQRVVSAIPKENRKDLAAAVVRRMGRATAGQQNDAGDAFSTNTFLTNWSALSPEAKATLFGRTGDARLLDELATLAGVSSNIREGSKVFANPSGTSGAAAGQMLGMGGVASAITGNVPALAGVVAAPLGANLLARYMTSPNRLAELSRQAERPTESIAAMTNALAQIGSR